MASLQGFTTRACTLAALLGLAQTGWAQAAHPSYAEMLAPVVLQPAQGPESEMLAKARTAVGFIQRMELPQANQAINAALQLDARNSYLHFLNGFVYHLQARQGDTQKSDLAIEGYQQALRLDRSNWIAQEFLGLAYLEQKKFEPARTQFSEALLMAPDSTLSLYGLMVVSYLSGDATTACAMADQFQKVTSTPPEGFVRSSVAVYASCAAFDKAEQQRLALARFAHASADGARLDQRLNQWKAFYRRQEDALRSSDAKDLAQKTSLSPGGQVPAPSEAAPQRLAQAFSMPDIGSTLRAAGAADSATPAQADATAGVAASTAPMAATAPAAPPDDGSPRMVLVDVVLVSTQELVSTSRGINLLNALTLQLGSVSGNVAAYSEVYSSRAANAAAADVSTAITRAVTIPALSYSLNIANANSSINEVLARPTLAAIEGLPSEFFSGTNLSAGVVSTSTQGGTTIVPLDKRFGVKLSVTPAFLPNGMVRLKVEAQRTSLNATADNPKAAYQIEIAETTANANVVMALGDTLMLSGLSERSSSSTRDGVPLLQDIPVLQYFFSNKKTNDIQRSVLILVTPRAPAYTNRAERAGVAQSESTRALRAQFGFAGSTPGNVEAILQQLSPGAFFREFRQGDVSMERWERSQTTGDRLRQVLQFLYY